VSRRTRLFSEQRFQYSLAKVVVFTDARNRGCVTNGQTRWEWPQSGANAFRESLLPGPMGDTTAVLSVCKGHSKSQGHHSNFSLTYNSLYFYIFPISKSSMRAL
jgi:hypothetical protein